MRALRVSLLGCVVLAMAAVLTGPPPDRPAVAPVVAQVAPEFGLAPALTTALTPAADVTAAFPTLVPGTPCLSSARACIDLSANESWLLEGGAVAYGPVPITHGRKGYRTPPGTFRVTFKNIDHESSIYDNAPMPYSVFFNGGIAFHQGSLRQLSHGCIHLSRTAAKNFFATLDPGDAVQVAP